VDATLLISLLCLASTTEKMEPAIPVHVSGFDTIQYSLKDRRAVWIGKPFITVTRDDAVLRCRRLTTDSADQDQIRKATCSGDVKLTRGKDTVTCETATFDNPSGKVICEGNPVLRTGSSMVSGSRLIYDINAGVFKMTGRGRGRVVPSPEQEQRLMGSRKDAPPAPPPPAAESPAAPKEAPAP
jgi:lipopolysaccharide export system protein LptA